MRRTAQERFGVSMHFALKQYVYEGLSCVEEFSSYWSRYKDQDLIYSPGHDWSRYLVCGMKFARLFEEQFPKLGLTVILAENKLRLHDTGETIQPDFIGIDSQKRYVVMDYKVTEQPVIWEDVKQQMVAGALGIKREINPDQDIWTIVCNFVVSHGIIIWLTNDITDSDYEAYIKHKKERSEEQFDRMIGALDLSL